MANTLSGILPTLFAQALLTLREYCVMPRLVNTDFADVPAGLGSTVNVSIPTPAAVSDVAPGATPVTPADSIAATASIALNKWRKAGYYLTDKERGEIFQGHIPTLQTEAVRALANDVNAFILSKYVKVYGFSGTPGSTPFSGTNVADATAARKILNLQLAPTDSRRGVLDPSAEANFLTLISNAAFRGTDTPFVQGSIGRIMGADWFMDQQIPTHPATNLTAGAATVNGVNAIGAGSTDGGRTGTVSIAKATNTSPLIAGDILTIAGDPQTYVVLTGVTLAVGNTTVSIAPALKKATAGGEAVSLKAAHVVNLFFQQNAFAFASRRLSSVITPFQLSVADPVSQVVFRAELIRQNKQDYVEFDILYGAECIRPELAMRIAG